MLLYVDKKKEKRRKLKKISVVFFLALVLIGNILHFKTALHTPQQALTSYSSIRFSQNWYNKAEVVYFFANPDEVQQLIVIPKNFNRENTVTTALAFSKLQKNATTLFFTPEVTHQEELQKLAKIFFPSLTISNADTADILLTTEVNALASIIRQKKLSPIVLNYKRAEKLLNLQLLETFLDTYFPLFPAPADPQEKELLSLRKFAEKYRKELQNLLLQKQISDFSAQNLFLQNAKICIKTENKTVCRTSSETSLKKNLLKALQSLPEGQSPQKLFFLTSELQIPEFSSLKDNEGLHFRCQNRETMLLPENISALANKNNAFYILKKRAGLNPQYTSPDMTFYKFKTMEIDINDSI